MTESFTLHRTLFPRLHLAEVEDQSWCPPWLREHTHKALSRTWRLPISRTLGSPAEQACSVLIDQLGGLQSASKYTYVDACAGAGGPTPHIERRMNELLRQRGLGGADFVLTDLWPDVEAWRELVRANPQGRVRYVEQPVDATKAVRIVGNGQGKECRMFNLSFHHFDDPVAEQVLESAVASADAFV